MNASSGRLLAYRLFQQVMPLLLIYHAALLFDLPVADRLRYLWMLTGLTGGGLYVIAAERKTDVTGRALQLTVYGWPLVLIVGVFVPLLWFKLAVIAFVLQIIVWWLAHPTALLRTLEQPPPITIWPVVPLVWALGMGVCLLFDSHLLAALALGFWLMHRFSNITYDWMNRGLLVVASLLLVGELLLALRVVVMIVPVLYVFLGGHSYRALSDRNSSRTLAAHWYALGLLAWLIGGGILGPLLAWVYPWVVDTYLTEARLMLVNWGGMAVLLGLVNQASAELRQQNRRVTGLMPFWFVSFGSLGACTGLAAAGLVQVYLARRLGFDAVTVQQEIAPLLLGWRFGLVLVFTGLLLYALGFWLRRVRMA